MSHSSSSLERAAIAYVVAVHAHEQAPLGTPESAKRAADVVHTLDLLRAAVADLSIPSDQRDDVARFIHEGGKE